MHNLPPGTYGLRDGFTNGLRWEAYIEAHPDGGYRLVSLETWKQNWPVPAPRLSNFREHYPHPSDIDTAIIASLRA